MTLAESTSDQDMSTRWNDETDIAIIRAKIQKARFVYIRAEIGINVAVSKKVAREFLAEVYGRAYLTSQLQASVYTSLHSGTVSVFLGKRD